MADELWMVAGLVAVVLVMGVIFALQVRFAAPQQGKPGETPTNRKFVARCDEVGPKPTGSVDDPPDGVDPQGAVPELHNESGKKPGEEES